MYTFLICVAILAITEGGSGAPGPEELRPLSRNITHLRYGMDGLDDIKYTEEQLRWRNTPPELRAGVKLDTEKWPGAKVPYTINRNLPRNQRRLIPQAIKMIEDNTCVRFVRRTREKNYVEILRQDPGSCWSRLGYLGDGKQELNLGGWSDGSPCSAGSTAHEMMHTLGIEHEQNRPDRDDYITIDFDKIPEDWRSQYYKNDPNERSTYNLDYGYDSIMHYHVYSPDGTSTQVMFPKQDVDINTIGQRDHLAAGDIALINAMYNCKT